MENSRQRKCDGSGWQLLPEQQQNQISSGNVHLHSSARAKPGSHFQSVVQEGVSQWSPGLNVNQMGAAGPGSSFLSLLSGPPGINPSEVAPSGGHPSVGATVSEVSRLSSMPFTVNVGGRHGEAGRVSVDQGSGSGSNFYHQVLQRDLQPLDIPKADAPYGHETQINFSDPRVGYICGASAPNGQKNHVENTLRVLHRVPPKNDSSVSSLPSSVLTAGPRVFCLGLSGNLLCNSGLLGIICTCHGLHTSIAKFAEHSGSRNVNPGTAVHVDGGETIAHWRKAYFLKLGIRIPEDHIGWDWPLGPSVTAGSLQHGQTLPKLSTDAHFHNKNSSFGDSVHSGDQWNHILPPKKAQTGENVNEVCHDEKPKSTREDTSCNFKGLSSSAKCNLKFVSDDHLMGYSRSVCSTMPSSFGLRTPYDLCPPLSSGKDPIYESGIPSQWQKLNAVGKDVATGRCVGSLSEDMISSNVELRLGQPSQQNQAMPSGRSAMPVPGTLPIIHGQPPKPVFLDQSLCITSTSRSTESRQPGYFTGIIPSSSVRTEMTKLNDLKRIRGACRVPNASQLKTVKKSASCSNAASELFTNVRNPCEEKSCFELSNGAIKVSHGIPKLQFGPSLANAGQSGFSFSQEKITDSRICNDTLNSQKHQKVEEVRRCTIYGLQGTAENLGTQTKTTANMLSFCGITGEGSSGGIARDSGHTNFSVVQDKVSNIWQFSDMRANAPDPSSTLKYYGQVSYPILNGPIPSSFETFGSPLELGTILSSQTFPLGNCATNSISGNNFVASTGNRSTGTRQYFLGESSKGSAYHSMPALPDDILAAGTSKTTPVQEESQTYYEKRQTAPLQKNCCNFTDVQNASEVAMHSQVSANRSSEEKEKLPSVTDKRHNFQDPVVFEGCNSQGKNVEAQCHIHSDLEQSRQLFKRFVNNANASSILVGNCYQDILYGHFLNKCNFTRQSDCIPGRRDILGNCSAGELKEVEGNAVDSVEAFHGPKLSETYKFTKKGDSFAAKSVVHDMKKAEFNTFEWRDVPRKVGKDVNESDTKGHEEPAYHAQREHEMSTLSSGCSAPAVTQLSIEANKKDSSSVDGAVKDILIVDEGSRIERCGSSDGNSGRSADFNGIPSKFNSIDRCSSKASVSKPFYGLKDECWFRDSPNFRILPSQDGTNFSIQTNLESESLRGKGKSKRLDSSISAANSKSLKGGADATQHFPDAKNKRILSQCDQQSFTGPCSVLENVKRVPRLSSGASRKRGLNLGIQVEKTDEEAIFNAQNDFAGASEEIQRKRMRLVGSAEGLELDKSSDGIVIKTTTGFAAVECNATSGNLVGGFCRRRPVVGGKYGIISNDVTVNPAKIVSLRTIMKRAKRCCSDETGKVDSVIVKESKKVSLNNKKEAKNKVSCMVSSELNSLHPSEGSEESYFSGSEDSCNLPHALKKRRHGWRRSHTILDSEIDSDPGRKYKKIRMRSLSDLAAKGDPICSKPANLKDGMSSRLIKSRFVSKANDSTIHADAECIADKHSKEYSYRKGKDSELSCCVCGTSDTDDCNCLLQCNTCLIKVHQACYGISVVPKAPWYCRPCKTSSKNIACVLCGYGGGAMTRARRTCDVVKSLLRVWGIVTESSSKNLEFSGPLGKTYQMLPSTKPAGQSESPLFIRPAKRESGSVDTRDTDLSEHHVGALDIPSSAPDSLVSSNSITAGVHDSTVKQWVHMVCGLWTPGTRCPNVDTMSSFDVSGASQPNHDVVCSICQRPGGTCIQCRVDYCHVQFHPWCAHEKGLLQSEVEGADNQSVGFYGRCMLHEMRQQVDPDSNDSSCAGQVERESTCARTEGYKGRKRDGFYVNCGQNGGSGCLVPQEQLDAWNYINRLKSKAKAPPKLPTSVVEYDCRKEYARYKQSRGWKQLVVYKSGIHGLGLYTSQFIPRGAMVVEYVGEIVGGHVADKREAEYQAGKKLQYKSACYFFRIDKEHIIDATRKGGIARFVNHSCSPNCVAKVISVRAEKKVVFFAERDMYPGEEVTYDYHFNHEDEGKKLACYCKAKNCRRYLN